MQFGCKVGDSIQSKSSIAKMTLIHYLKAIYFTCIVQFYVVGGASD